MLFVDLDSFSGLRLDDLVLTPSTAVALLVSTASSAACPHCGQASQKIHSHYRRTVADLPGQDRALVLRLLVRRFRCLQPGCPRQIFCERLPGRIGTYARATDRLTSAHRALGLALGGEPGARLATHLEMPTSGDTILRRVKHGPKAEPTLPRCVGIDDWALCKGQRYGTIIVDLERGQILELLPGRDGEALKAWLREHPGIEVITRDRWAAYAEAAKEASPQAQQVADRWHLLRNLRETVERFLARLSAAVRAALQNAPVSQDSLSPSADRPVLPEPAPTPAPANVESTEKPTSQRELERQTKRRLRAERHQQINTLRAKGRSQRQIAQALDISIKCVRHHLRSVKCPDWNPGRRAPTQLDGLRARIDAWIERGGRNAAALYRELHAEGCTASYDAVRRFLQRRLGSTGKPGPRVGLLQRPSVPPSSARRLSFLFLRRAEDRTTEEQALIDRLHAGEVALREGLALAGTFAALVRKEVSQPLADWLVAVSQSSCTELHAFAQGVQRDLEAIQAALTEPWSNGPVEGQVNRLKLVKRQMYGRAGWQLLRARLTQAA